MSISTKRISFNPRTSRSFMKRVVRGLTTLRKSIYRGHHVVRLRKFSRSQWVEVDERMFEASFELLREFVEDQCAWMTIVSSNTYSWWDRFKFQHFSRRYRAKVGRQLGLEHLNWEISDTDDVSEQSSQAHDAQLQRDLYLWYMDVYSVRSDPYDSIGDPPRELFSFTPCEYDADGNPAMYEMIQATGPEVDEYNRKLDAAFEEEERFYKESTDKLMELVNIRRTLWT